MLVKLRLAAFLTAVAALHSGAHAHVGDHSTFSVSDFLSHLAEPDHLAALGLVAVLVIFARRALQRRREATLRVERKREPRQ